MMTPLRCEASGGDQERVIDGFPCGRKMLNSSGGPLGTAEIV